MLTKENLLDFDYGASVHFERVGNYAICSYRGQGINAKVTNMVSTTLTYISMDAKRNQIRK